MTRDYETPPLPFAGDPDRTCPYCGFEEPNDFLLRNNHAHDSAFATREGICVAMDLTRNHVFYDVQQVLNARTAVAAAELQGQPTKAADRHLRQAEARLTGTVARVREVWPDPTWLTEVLNQLGDDAS